MGRAAGREGEGCPPCFWVVGAPMTRCCSLCVCLSPLRVVYRVVQKEQCSKGLADLFSKIALIVRWAWLGSVKRREGRGQRGEERQRQGLKTPSAPRRTHSAPFRRIPQSSVSQPTTPSRIDPEQLHNRHIQRAALHHRTHTHTKMFLAAPGRASVAAGACHPKQKATNRCARTRPIKVSSALSGAIGRARERERSARACVERAELFLPLSLRRPSVSRVDARPLAPSRCGDGRVEARSSTSRRAFELSWP